MPSKKKVQKKLKGKSAKKKAAAKGAVGITNKNQRKQLKAMGYIEDK